jgi:hypothetical protein
MTFYKEQNRVIAAIERVCGPSHHDQTMLIVRHEEDRAVWGPGGPGAGAANNTCVTCFCGCYPSEKEYFGLEKHRLASEKGKNGY